MKFRGLTVSLQYTKKNMLFSILLILQAVHLKRALNGGVLNIFFCVLGAGVK